MPEIPPDPARRRWRPTILAFMIFVALAAVWLGVWRYKMDVGA